ncbi:unnamed protein product [Boreogadus saida]
MLQRDHERDTDLDKRIQALRRKNAVLMRRYQEVEEDKKMAEEDVVSPQGRKGKADDLSITISKSASESRVVVAKRCALGGQPGAGPGRAGEGSLPGCGRGRKKQLTVTMAGKKGKRVVSERAEPGPPGDGVRGPDEDRPAQGGDAAGGAKHAHHASSKRGPAAMQCCLQPRVVCTVTLATLPKEYEAVGEGDASGHTPACPGAPKPHGCLDSATSPVECEVAPPCTDLTVPTSPEELQDYLCWKRDRERIDRERVARHKNAKGQWRRAWDVDKSESMFSDKCLPEKERGPTSRGGRNARRAHPRTHLQESQGPVRDKVKDKGPKGVPGVSSKAQGVDRLTGRARRWDADEAGEPAQSADTSLEELLEELDASSEPEDKEEDDADDQGGERRDRDPPKGKTFPGPEVVHSGGSPAAGGGRPRMKNGAVSCPRGPEKRVRFSEELIKGAERPTASKGPAVPQTPLPREGGEVAVVGEAREVGVVGEAGEVGVVVEVAEEGEVAEMAEGVEVAERGEVAETGEVGETGEVAERGEVAETGEVEEPNGSLPIPRGWFRVLLRDPPTERSLSSRSLSSRSLSSRSLSSRSLSSRSLSSRSLSSRSLSSRSLLSRSSPEGPPQHAKSNISNRNTEERIEGLSVLSLESRDTCSKAATNTDKARENGKIV